jgi:uncharacterized protein (UPF0262 family)
MTPGRPAPPASTTSHLAHVTLEGEPLTRLVPVLEADRAQAIADLLAENVFAPKGAPPGPYGLRLSIHEGRLVFDIRRPDNTPATVLVLALGPFRSLIRDYRLLVESHALAVQEGREERIQAIDMGRRGLHNEGAELLMQRLAGKVTTDFATARRLFTLICALYQRP